MLGKLYCSFIFWIFLVAAKPTTLVETNSSSFFLLSFFLIICPKMAKTVQTNMVAYVILAINFKSEVRSDLRGYLEAVVASEANKTTLAVVQVGVSENREVHYRGE